MRRSFRAILLSSVALVAIAGSAAAQSDPPARIGRLAYMQGTVSFHDAQQDTWSAAVVNTPITTGDALWTEPNGHDEIMVGGSRVRMDGDTQLDMLAIDDSQVRMQLDQGRLDIKTFNLDSGQPQVVTPRGTVILEQQGDYYIHAGTTNDPTLIGVRAGSARFQGPTGQALELQAGQVGEISGDGGGTIQVQSLQTAPPPMPQYWAQRDQQISYSTPQYVSADVTGYEDMAAYGSWSSDPQYGEVWMPNNVSADWAPYTTGSWSYVGPWGWTWVDSSPWGFAPYHYGRWAHGQRGWFWVPPERAERPVYAPALVAFVGGAELGVAIGAQSRAPVGWFPLGPREAYVPPYTSDRNYYQRMNRNDRVEAAVMNDRWQRAERHEALRADERNEALMNRRFATVMAADDFAHSRSVQQAHLRVDEAKLAAMPVAAVAAPPSPTRSLLQAQPNGAGANQQGPNQQGPNQQGVARPNEPRSNDPNAHAPANAQTRFGGLEAIGRPTQQPTAHAPGPQIAAHAQQPANGKPALPPLAPRSAVPPPHVQGERTPGASNAGQPQAPTPPQANRVEPPHAGQSATPQAQPQHVQPQASQPQPPHPAAEAPRGPQQVTPQQQAHTPPPPSRPATEAPQAHAPAPQGQPQVQPQAHVPAPAPSQPLPQAHVAPPQPQPQAQPQAHVAPPQPQPQAHVAPPQPQPQAHVAPPQPQPQVHAPAPQPAPQQVQQHAAPAPQQQAHPAPAPQPQQAQHPAPKQDEKKQQ
jgi:hypothetical protein